MQRWISKYIKSLTLKKRIVFLFTVVVFIPFLVTTIVSYNAIYSILENKLEENVQSNLKQVELTLDHLLDNLNQTSQQFVYPGNLAIKLEEYLTTDDVTRTITLENEIKNELVYSSHSNSVAGLTTYIAEDGTILFRNLPIKDSSPLENLPVLDEYRNVTYYGPHLSNNNLQTHYVLSLLREVNLPNEEQSVYIYIETNFNFIQRILEVDQISKNSFYLLLDDKDRVTFSELNSLFPVNYHFDITDQGEESGLINGYYWFMKTNKEGWSIVSLIAQNDYNEEKNKWIVQMLVLAVIFGLLSIIISWLIWVMVYKPIRNFEAEIKAITTNNFQYVSLPSNIPEYDDLLEKFHLMKTEISDLIQEIEIKEKKRADLEIEKLMHQINPHFLMNTLDTVRWLAVLNNQDEINRVVSSLNKLLYYNLKRQGKASTIAEELESLNEYCKLQEIRYQFTYNVEINVDPELLETTVPRFILQPIVENAIYHGLDDDGRIDVEVNQKNNHISISIHDNGIGFSESEKKEILECGRGKNRNGVGIGMNYVKRMLESHYKDQAHMKIISGKQGGTTIIISIPLNRNY
ncbi:sensor histidine kinase [Salipaludibacillus sp. HK11]|uniref:sensor histidine kinase n=1 Tax=Salipaludibacillus sp. HK11 TaxID=3394320 RepID=UPI0039FC26B8